MRIDKPDFVPRRITGFQVKKPDMPPGAIGKEMRPHGHLRPVIRELAALSGAYIIVSAQGSVADKPLADRRAAIRKQLSDVAEAEALHTDFYDRDRLANWVNEYPGISAWVRDHIGRGIAGWSSIGSWAGTAVVERSPFLFDDKACLTDERSAARERLTIGEGISRLRDALRSQQRCIRLIGLSGLGKTRLVQALFESGVGEEALDPSTAIYTDYSVETEPTARDMARQLVTQGQPAILIVDNCNPATHSELARICSDASSKVCLLTVEYDVQDDEPEQTDVFRLQSASPELVSQWLEQTFPNVSVVDRRRIAEFSDGNFRVGRALAETLRKGETLGKLKSRELFQRIFQQRKEPDQNLLLAAEDLSLLFSIDGEDSSDAGELALVGSIRSTGANALYAALTELRRRGILQSRGRWRAILPHAVANPLAHLALERIPPAEFDRFCLSLSLRMQKSLSKRLGFLHDSVEARAVTIRLLRDDGPFGNVFALGADGLQIVSNLAPAAPEAVLERIERKLDGVDGDSIRMPGSTGRMQWIRLIKLLGYEPQAFERAATLLARFLAAEPEDSRNNSARDAFAELFHLYLSGTQAFPHQRRELIKRFASSGKAAHMRCASVALDALLTANHFSSSSDFDFGARSRDWGWSPKINGDTWDWYNAAINLAVELAPVLDDARDILAGRARELWRFGACHDALDLASLIFVRERPWIEGWLGFRAALRFEGASMPVDIKAKLKEIIQRLKPSDLLHKARAVILSRGGSGWDIVDGEPDEHGPMHSWERASQMAHELGRLLAQDSKTRLEFIRELLPAPNQQRSAECGEGLAEGADRLFPIWSELIAEFALADPQKRNPLVLGGFIFGAHKRDVSFVHSALEEAIGSPTVGNFLPYLQGRAGIDKDGIARLQRAIRLGALRASDFHSITNGVVMDSPSEELGALLLDIGEMEKGVGIALGILNMHLYRGPEDMRPHDESSLQIGRALLRRFDFKNGGAFQGLDVDLVLRACCSGSCGVEVARNICANICSSLESGELSFHNLSYVLTPLFESQPVVALDSFLLRQHGRRNFELFEEYLPNGNPIQNMDLEVLRQWAQFEPATRYPLIAQAIAMFSRDHGGESNDLSPLFLQMLEFAPDKFAFLGDGWTRLHPRGWSGSLADILACRREVLLKFREGQNTDVHRWIDEVIPELDRWIEVERTRDREQEASFE